MKILLIGANGTLGRMIADHCSDDEVVRTTQLELDLRTPDHIRPYVERIRPDVVVNASAYNDVDAAETHPDEAILINATAVGALAKAARAAQAGFVHFSTDYVFDGTAPHGYTERDRPNPQSQYATSKFRGEILALEAHPETLLIRTSRLYGEPGGSQSSKQSFPQRMIELSKSRNVIEVVDDEVSSPTYARDLALAAHGLIHAGARGIFHRTNDGACTWYEFAKAIFAETGWRGTLRPVPGSRFPRPAKRPAASMLLTTKLPPLRRWEKALSDHLQRIIPQS